MTESGARVLIVDDDANVREALRRSLTRTGYRCFTASSAENSAPILKSEEIDLVLLDIDMSGASGMKLLPIISERFPDIAVVMLTGNADVSTAIWAMREGAYDYVTKPVSMDILSVRVEKALDRQAQVREHRANRAASGATASDRSRADGDRILVVDDEEHMREALQRGLSKSNYVCFTATSADNAVEVLGQEEIDLILLDINMPGMSGIQLLPTITSRYPDVPVLMLSGLFDIPTAVMAMREGATDYATKPVDMDILAIRIEKALSGRALNLDNRAFR